MKINFFPQSKTEAMKIAREYIKSTDGLAYDMNMSVEEVAIHAEIICEHRIVTVMCGGETALKLYYQIDE